MIRRFTGFRENVNRNESVFGQLEPVRKEHENPWNEPQYEGVVWSDGSVSVKWLTKINSQSNWRNLSDFLTIHGHPEYGTYIEWHDHPRLPNEYEEMVIAHRPPVTSEEI
jgi:hypothetical protein